jgi:hypothetical protein
VILWLKDFCVEEMMTDPCKTPKQFIEAIAAIEHDDLTGLYDEVSVEGAITAFVKYITRKNKETQEAPNQYHYTTRQIRTELLNEILEDLKKDE